MSSSELPPSSCPNLIEPFFPFSIVQSQIISEDFQANSHEGQVRA